MDHPSRTMVIEKVVGSAYFISYFQGIVCNKAFCNQFFSTMLIIFVIEKLF